MKAISRSAGCRQAAPEQIDQAVQSLAEVLRICHGASVCLIVVSDVHVGKARLYRTDVNSTALSRGESLDSDLADLMLFDRQQAVIFSRTDPGLCIARAYDPDNLRRRRVDSRQFFELANLLEANSFISLPLRWKRQRIGRIHLGSRRSAYSLRDLRALAPAVEKAAEMIVNVRMLGRLALAVGSEERRRISRDLHDGTIQPYIGLKLGLEALRRKARTKSDLVQEIDELISMAGDGVNQLRHYVGSLKGGGRRRHTDSLLPTLRSEAEKFAEFYGIETRVLADDDIPVTAELHDEIVHIVREGLSNIRRHTSADHALVRLRKDDGRLRVELVNDNAGRKGARRRFFPQSIGERARELGGRLSVRHRGGRYTVVAVELPMSV